MEKLIQERSTHECLHGYYYETDVLPSNMREFIAYVDRSRARLSFGLYRIILEAERGWTAIAECGNGWRHRLDECRVGSMQDCEEDCDKHPATPDTFSFMDPDDECSDIVSGKPYIIDIIGELQDTDHGRSMASYCSFLDSLTSHYCVHSEKISPDFQCILEAANTALHAEILDVVPLPHDLHGVVMQYLLPADDWFERRLRIIRGLLKIGT